jgi:hypothetical protein
VTRCPKCFRYHGGPRSAANLVAAITRVSHQMLGMEDDKARILLRLQLRVLTAELDFLCQSCQWERAAQEHHDASAGALALGQAAAPTPEQIEASKLEGARGGAGADRPAEPGASSVPHVCRVLPLRRDPGVRFKNRGTVYEQSSAGEQLHATCRADAPDGSDT